MTPEDLGLPHREPFVFVDTLKSVTPGQAAYCEKTFLPGNPIFEGHFPGEPLVPGVLLAEALAQTAGIAGASGRQGRRFLLSAIRSMKFPAAARPGDLIELEATKSAEIGGLLQFNVRAMVGETTVAEGSIVLNDTST